MINELKNLFYIIIIFLFIFLTGKHYFSDEYKKKSYRNMNSVKENIHKENNSGIIASKMYTDGSYRDLLFIEEAKSLAMEGNRVFKHAVSYLSKAVTDVIDSVDGIEESDIDWLVPHQANYRIIAAAANKLNLPMEKVVLTLQHHGNTSSASVPLALDVAVKSGQINPGDLLLLEAFGSGFVWGAILLRF